VKKPVAVPKTWTVPNGKVWVVSTLQVTRSPCTLCLDAVSVSVWVGPPGGVNSKAMLLRGWPKSVDPQAPELRECELASLHLIAPVINAWGKNTAVLPTTWPGVNSPLPLTTNWTVCPLSQVAGN
jgi:hypothetical protein